MRQLIIEESKWYRGQGGVQSRLRRLSDGKMCCLGFDALACGATEADITSEAFPSGLGVIMPPSMAWLLEHEMRIGHVNDDDTITDDVRKERLRPLFAVGGVELVFVP